MAGFFLTILSRNKFARLNHRSDRRFLPQVVLLPVDLCDKFKEGLGHVHSKVVALSAILSLFNMSNPQFCGGVSSQRPLMALAFKEKTRLWFSECFI